MSVIVYAEDYLDNDVAYLLGLILIRGAFHIEGDIRRLIIQFPYKSLEVKTLPGSKMKIDKETAIRLSLDQVRNRIQELLGVDVQINRSKNEVDLVAVFVKNTMAWRNLITLFNNKRSYLEFSVPEIIFSAPQDIQKDFVRGIADSSSTPSPSDVGRIGEQRVVIEFPHKNWGLPVQLCRLLQENLGVKVNHILWGHPNVRTPNQKDSKNWPKEHRMRILPNDFISIGYNFDYKQKLFEELVEWNNKHQLCPETKFCNPKIKKVRGSPKPKHKEEKSRELPECLRKHFNAYFQICRALGCEQGKPSNQFEMFEDEDG